MFFFSDATSCLNHCSPNKYSTNPILKLSFDNVGRNSQYGNLHGVYERIYKTKKRTCVEAG